ncbi:prolyl oligopeptidase family serine peptidase [Streptomyces sp. DSM 15324]|uniref:prolyl oligopeptidase family serine peptidase n=1 Tax=Streptomyces sp. DSM 15324 TaxID=1739111 RepID=UPI00074742D0|nr:prolyl oligopeptidase family serine peptidase [Streptomyces sp. DSM 15324]KUO11934.1 dienelactone hydrolase [Streptomyces sp. DSM 15324]
MAQQLTPARTARLGKAIGPEPTAVSGVVLLLPGGEEVSERRPSPMWAAASVRGLGRRLTRAGREEGLVTHVVHYRYRGWNGGAAHLAADATWAADEVVRRYGDVPVCLAGTGMGGRAALRAGGHAAVNSVLALAPWLPQEDVAAPPEPVKQLVGRRVMVVHGTHDDRSDPELSFRLAARVKKANRDVCRFEVHADGHGLHQYRDEVLALAEDFVMGVLFGRTFSRPVEDALAAPPPLGLRMPLAAGFGKSLRR